MQRSALCRSRRELSNAYFLAKVRFDTAEITRPVKFAASRAGALPALRDVVGDGHPGALLVLAPVDGGRHAQLSQMLADLRFFSV